MFKAISQLFQNGVKNEPVEEFSLDSESYRKLFVKRMTYVMHFLVRQGFDDGNSEVIAMVEAFVLAEFEGKITGDSDERINQIIRGMHKLAQDNPIWLTLEQRQKVFEAAISQQAELDEQSGHPLPEELKVEMLEKLKNKLGLAGQI